MNRIARILTVIGLAQSVIIVLIVIAAKKNIGVELIILLIGCLIANIPIGLVVAVIINLIIRAKKLVRHRLLVKNLESVETLGSISCLFCDKTGTLTTGEMRVQHVWLDNGLIDCTEPGLDSLKQLKSSSQNSTLMLLAQCAVIANQIILTEEETNKDTSRKFSDCTILMGDGKNYCTIGNSVDVALIKFFNQLEHIPTLRARYRVAILGNGQEAKK